MSKTSIAWTDATWNPVTGCSKVSDGCRYCYAEAVCRRFGRSFEVELHPARLNDPLHWRIPQRIFVCSMSDLFHEKVPDEFIAEVWDRMASATADCGKNHKHEEECWCGPSHTFQILTKRPSRMLDFLLDTEEAASGISRVTEYWSGDCCYSIRREVDDWPLPNVWLGVSVENARNTWRADILRRVPAAVRFISAEPLLGPLVTPCPDCHGLGPRMGGCRYCAGRGWIGLNLTGIDWLVIGGESGPHRRPMDPQWAIDLYYAARASGTRVFIKQGSALRPGQQGVLPDWLFQLREFPLTQEKP